MISIHFQNQTKSRRILAFGEARAWRMYKAICNDGATKAEAKKTSELVRF